MSQTASRLNLHKDLCRVLNNRNAYFQPPASLQMNYPCIRYEYSDIKSVFANNKNYLNTVCYQLTLIDEDPDSEIVQAIVNLPMCRFVRFYTASNLNHWVFVIFY